MLSVPFAWAFRLIGVLETAVTGLWALFAGAVLCPYFYYGSVCRPKVRVLFFLVYLWLSILILLLYFKLSLCSEYCMLSSG